MHLLPLDAECWSQFLPKTSSRSLRKDQEIALGSYLPTQVPLLMHILFLEERLVSSFSGVHKHMRWQLSWEWYYSKGTQSSYTKKERQRLEKKRRGSQRMREICSCLKQKRQRQVPGSERKNREGQGNGMDQSSWAGWDLGISEEMWAWEIIIYRWGTSWWTGSALTETYQAAQIQKQLTFLSTYCVHGGVCHILYIIYSTLLLLDIEVIMHTLKVLKGLSNNYMIALLPWPVAEVIFI